jgi:adenylate cyclase
MHAGEDVKAAVERIVAPDARLTLSEVAARAGTTDEDVRRLWHAWGFPDPEPDDRRFAEVDAELVRFAVSLEPLVGPDAAYHTARVMGLAIGRIAEAEVAMLRAAVEAPMRAQGATDADVVAALEPLLVTAMGAADRTLTTLHRHHLVETVRRHIDWSVPASPHNVLDIVVGFADLTGSTRLAAARALDELDRALAAFEERTSDVLARAGASLVKRIGDAVMFTTPDATTAARVATEMVDAFASDPVVPPVRVGLAAGAVVARRGDFYGLPVALAARLQAIAEPSQVLADDETRRRLADAAEWAWRDLGRRDLAGFPEPVAVHALRRAGTMAS